jgi:hypothetical protein
VARTAARRFSDVAWRLVSRQAGAAQRGMEIGF